MRRSNEILKLPASEAVRYLALEAFSSLQELLRLPERRQGADFFRLVTFRLSEIRALMQVHQEVLGFRWKRRPQKVLAQCRRSLQGFSRVERVLRAAEMLAARKGFPPAGFALAASFRNRHERMRHLLLTTGLPRLAARIPDLQEGFENEEAPGQEFGKADLRRCGEVIGNWVRGEASRVVDICRRPAEELDEADAVRLNRMHALLAPWLPVFEGSVPLMHHLRPREAALQNILDQEMLLVGTTKLEGKVSGLDALLDSLGRERSRNYAAWTALQGENETVLDQLAGDLAVAFDDAAKGVQDAERIFLLRRAPRLDHNTLISEVYIGWLPGRGVCESIRRVYGQGVPKHFRRIQLGQGGRQLEVEEETTEEVFDTLWALTAGQRERKRRYSFREGERSWDIDEFHDRDLVLARVFGRQDVVASDPPNWLAFEVEREVTGDTRFLGRRLGC
ncbi:MAG: hypothetical protein ACI97A_000583 [Planctomycetota bacterium]|jgi:hypothetical protein